MRQLKYTPSPDTFYSSFEQAGSWERAVGAPLIKCCSPRNGGALTRATQGTWIPELNKFSFTHGGTPALLADCSRFKLWQQPQVALGKPVSVVSTELEGPKVWLGRKRLPVLSIISSSAKSHIVQVIIVVCFYTAKTALTGCIQNGSLQSSLRLDQSLLPLP